MGAEIQPQPNAMHTPMPTHKPCCCFQNSSSGLPRPYLIVSPISADLELKLQMGCFLHFFPPEGGHLMGWGATVYIGPPADTWLACPQGPGVGCVLTCVPPGHTAL